MNRLKSGLILIVLISFLAFVAIMPVSCVFHTITGIYCPACGITRAFNELFSLHFQKAYEYNPRIIIVAPLMLFIWISTLIREIKLRKST